MKKVISKATTAKDPASGVLAEQDRRISAIEEQLDGLSTRIHDQGQDIGTKMDSLMEAIIASRQAPGVVKRRLEADEQDLGKEHVATMGAGEDGDAVIVRPGPVSLDHPSMKSKLDYERFLMEPVTIEIATTAEKYADNVFEVAVGGKSFTFRRGETRTVPRYVVEGLARAKPIHFENEEYLRADGVQDVRWPTRTGLRYSFSVIEDSNPNGRAWLKSVLQQP